MVPEPTGTHPAGTMASTIPGAGMTPGPGTMASMIPGAGITPGVGTMVGVGIAASLSHSDGAGVAAGADPGEEVSMILSGVVSDTILSFALRDLVSDSHQEGMLIWPDIITVTIRELTTGSW